MGVVCGEQSANLHWLQQLSGNGSNTEEKWEFLFKPSHSLAVHTINNFQSVKHVTGLLFAFIQRKLHTLHDTQWATRGWILFKDNRNQMWFGNRQGRLSYQLSYSWPASWLSKVLIQRTEVRWGNRMSNTFPIPQTSTNKVLSSPSGLLSGNSVFIGFILHKNTGIGF